MLENGSSTTSMHEARMTNSLDWKRGLKVPSQVCAALRSRLERGACSRDRHSPRTMFVVGLKGIHTARASQKVCEAGERKVQQVVYPWFRRFRFMPWFGKWLTKRTAPPIVGHRSLSHNEPYAPTFPNRSDGLGKLSRISRRGEHSIADCFNHCFSSRNGFSD